MTFPVEVILMRLARERLLLCCRGIGWFWLLLLVFLNDEYPAVWSTLWVALLCKGDREFFKKCFHLLESSVSEGFFSSSQGELYFDPMAFGKKLICFLGFEGQVMLSSFETYANCLREGLFDARSRLLFFGLEVNVFTVVHNLADGGSGGGANFYQIKIFALSNTERVKRLHDTQRFAVLCDDLDFRSTDLMIDAKVSNCQVKEKSGLTSISRLI